MLKERPIYCLACDEEREYIVKKEKRKIKVKNLEFEVEIDIAFCKKCGEEVFPDEIAKRNDLVIYDEYRRKKGLLTSSEIREIRKKRNMSQLELAKFIRCGEKNIARYETGTIQDQVFDYLIRMVGDDNCYVAMKNMNKNANDIEATVKTKMPIREYAVFVIGNNELERKGGKNRVGRKSRLTFRTIQSVPC